jgi:ribonuclease-3
VKAGKYQELAQLLGYQFTKPSLLELALTHRSAGSAHNERLEFLGDAVLGFVVAEKLYLSDAQLSEGDLSRLRASLVSKPALASAARSLGLGQHLVLGSGEAKGGGRERDSLLADAVEAVIAAIYLDGGIEPAATLVRKLIANEASSGIEASAQKDSKTALQEFLQAQKRSLPAYRVISIDGAAHEQWFHIECEVEGLAQAVRGEGSSKKEAEQRAAYLALVQLGESQ